MGMARAKTGSFYLTETVTLPAANPASTPVQGEIDISPYVSIADGHAIAITAVDWIVQEGTTFSQELETMLASNGAISFQLTDLNPGTALIRADGQSLVASGALNIDQANNIGTHVADIYPDKHGPVKFDDAFLCVNGTLFVNAQNNGALIGAADVMVTCRAKCQIVSLEKRDWISIAVQATAESP